MLRLYAEVSAFLEGVAMTPAPQHLSALMRVGCDIYAFIVQICSVALALDIDAGIL